MQKQAANAEAGKSANQNGTGSEEPISSQPQSRPMIKPSQDGAYENRDVLIETELSEPPGYERLGEENVVAVPPPLPESNLEAVFEPEHNQRPHCNPNGVPSSTSSPYSGDLPESASPYPGDVILVSATPIPEDQDRSDKLAFAMVRGQDSAESVATVETRSPLPEDDIKLIDADETTEEDEPIEAVPKDEDADVTHRHGEHKESDLLCFNEQP